MLDLLGCVLDGKYRLTARLGSGSMATVYRGVDDETGQSVAVKVMHPALMKVPGMLTRFRREARALRLVRHPNAVRVLAHGVAGGLAYLAMELVEGEDLAEHLSREGCMAPDRAVRMMVEICDALAVAHACGLVHRDIKAENIMLGGASGAVIKLIDFGIVKPQASAPLDDDDEITLPRLTPVPPCGRHDEVDDVELTSTGALLGTSGYMAPEQWAGGPVDARTDVYGCGALLYLVLTGRLPFDDESRVRLMRRQLLEEPEMPHLLNPAVPPALSMIILRALMPVPEERYPSAGAMRDALAAYTLERALHRAAFTQPASAGKRARLFLSAQH